jgi:hypothetical protein
VTGRRWSDLDLKPHGTTAAYRRHYRRGTFPCDACKRAVALYQAERRDRLAADAAVRGAS